MSGAAILGGMAAMKSGAGLCTVACPLEIQPIVAAAFPCYTTLGFNQHASLLEVAPAFDVIAIGPGLGKAAYISEFLKLERPIVIDADGLNTLAPLNDFPRRTATILTPHPGEFARLTGLPAPKTHQDRLKAAAEFSKAHHVVLVLKGHRTLVCDGERVFANTTGNPGMATGGSGDILTGLIAALLGQGLQAFDAAVLGVYLHGLAGDLAAEAFGQVSMTALDLLQYLPQAFRRHASPSLN